MTWEYGIGGIGAYCVECEACLVDDTYLECGPRRLCVACTCNLLEQLENRTKQLQPKQLQPKQKVCECCNGTMRATRARIGQEDNQPVWQCNNCLYKEKVEC